MALRDLIAEAVGSLPRAEPARCVHSQLEVASCQRCVDVCPRQAWTLGDDALSIDTARCNGCGLCVAHCPEGALGLEGVSPDPFVGQRRLTLVCPQAAKDVIGWRLPCVNVIGFRTLRELYHGGLRQLTLQTGDCRVCPRHDVQGLVERLGMLNRVMRERASPQIELNDKASDGLPVQNEAGDRAPPTLSRRGFLRRVIGGAAGQDAEGTATPPQPLKLEAPAPGDLALFVPELDPGRCNGCDACARICPHGALSMAPSGEAYVISPDACTGCGLCTDVCDRNALCVHACSPIGAVQVILETRTCRACGARYHSPQAQAAEGAFCQVCARVNHHRKLFQVL